MEHYPAAEHYVFPRNAVEQARDELRLFPDGKSFRRSIVGLRHMYGATAFVSSMQRYASYAAVLKGEDGDGYNDQYRMNYDFYSGALVAAHVNIAPLPSETKRAVLSFNPLAHIDELPNGPEIEENIRNCLVDWTGGEDEEQTWYTFMSNQAEDYQEVATQMAARLLEGRLNAHEREVDFMSGFAFCSNLIWQTYHRANFGPPV